jgi:2'-5' RNA ligase
MDERAQLFFNRQRQEFFPKERNVLNAHITLFHKLPYEHQGDIQALLESLPNDRPFTAEANSLRFLGQGVAYTVSCQALVELRTELAVRWQDWLGPQDKNAFRPHITVQNKVEPAMARALYDTLSTGFTGMSFEITGLALWHYLQGPWSLIQRYRFG